MPSIRTSLSLAALLASTFLQAVEPLPYEANFERSGGFELGGLDGQRGWSVEEGSAVITDGEGREGSRALRLLNTHQYVECNPINLTDQLGLFPNAPNNVNPLRPPYDPRRPPLQGAARECIYKRRLIGQRGNVCIYGYAILTHDHSKCRDCEPIIKNLVRLPLTRWPSHHYNVRAGWCVEEISEGDRPIFL